MANTSEGFLSTIPSFSHLIFNLIIITIIIKLLITDIKPKKAPKHTDGPWSDNEPTLFS